MMGYRNKNILEFECKKKSSCLCDVWCKKNICKKHELPKIGTVKRQLSNYDLSIGKWQMIYIDDNGIFTYSLKLIEYI